MLKQNNQEFWSRCASLSHDKPKRALKRKSFSTSPARNTKKCTVSTSAIAFCFTIGQLMSQCSVHLRGHKIWPTFIRGSFFLPRIVTCFLKIIGLWSSQTGPNNLRNFAHSHITNYNLTAQSTGLLENLTVVQLVKKLPALYGTLKFITMFKNPNTGLYHEPAESSPNLTTLFA